MSGTKQHSAPLLAHAFVGGLFFTLVLGVTTPSPAAPSLPPDAPRCGTVSVEEGWQPPLNTQRTTDLRPFKPDSILLGEPVPLSALEGHSPIYIGAINGQAFFLERGSEGLSARPIATALPVYKAFGLSADGRALAYRPLDGTRPSPDLVVETRGGNAPRKVSDDTVMMAAWSPTDPDRIAYICSGGEGFGLAIYDLDANHEVARISSHVQPGILRWENTGDGVYYLDETLRVQNILDSATLEVVEQAPYSLLAPRLLSIDPNSSLEMWPERLPAGFPELEGQVDPESITPAIVQGEEGLPPGLYQFRVTSPDFTHEILGDNVLGSGALYTRSLPLGEPVLVAEGRLEATLEQGFVVRTYSEAGSTLQFYPWEALREETTVGVTASVTYKLPMKQAYVTQTAPGYSSTCYSTHTGTMSYAYDFAYGSSGAHIMASADGTVAYTYSNVTCNSCDSSDCSDYSSSCSANSGWGNVIILEHSDGTYTMYTHLAYGSLRVSTGSGVCAGLYMANQGHTGCAMGTGCGDHLHFQRQSGASTGSQSISIAFADANNPLTCGGYYVSGLTEVSSCGSSSETVIVDDLDAGFTRYGPSEYWWETTIGYNGHMWYTYVNGNDASNYARWKPVLGGSGNYSVSVFIPRDYATTQGARYAIVHNRVVDYHTVNQNAYYDEWVSLGTYDFNGRGFEYVVLLDATGESTDTGRMIAFDAVKFAKQ